jgi:SAM-dependent methyltransferase
MAGVTPDPIMKVALGFMAAKHLFVANEIGLFEQLAGRPATLDELAERTGVPRRTLRIVADAMVSLGFLEKGGDRYQNGEVAAAFLSGPRGAGLRPALRHLDRISYPLWRELGDAVRSGQGRSHWGRWSEDEQRIATEGIAALTAPVAARLAAGYGFSRHRHVLDLGGGTGNFLTAVLSRHAVLEATLYELPDTAAVARRYLAGMPEAARIKIVEGDFLKDPIPEGADVVIIANVVHILSPAQNRDVLRRTRRCVPGGARLLLVDFWTDSTHTRPPAAALLAGEFLLWGGEGDVYSAEEARGWLRETGWRVLEHTPLAGPASVIVAEAAEG